jgi:uncharacterized membrane protein YGL010W
MKITISYGALSDSIEKQLNGHGLTLGDKKKFIHDLSHSLTMCRFHVLTDSQYNAALKKLHKKVMEYAKPTEKGEVIEE